MATGNLREEYESERTGDDPDTFPSFTQWLTSRQLGAERGGRRAPNAAALLVHGVSPQDAIPGAFLELARYGGVDVDAVIINRKTVTGTIVAQLEAAWQWLEGNLVDEPAGEHGLVSEFSSEYPLDVLEDEELMDCWQAASHDGATVAACLDPVRRGKGDVLAPRLIEVEGAPGLWLLPGHLSLGRFEQTLAEE